MGIKKFASDGSRLSVFIGLVALLIFVASLLMTLRTTNESVSMIIDALKAHVENANEPDIGLQALVKSVLPDKLSDPIKQATLSPKVARIVASIESSLSQPFSGDACPTVAQNIALSRSVAVVSSNDFEPISQVSSSLPIDEYITEKTSI